MAVLPGLGAPPVSQSGSPFSVTYLGTPAAIETNAATHTYTGVSLGAEDPDRYISVAIVLLKAASVDPTSVTIAGISATILNPTGAGSWSTVFHAFAKVPTGTTGDIVVTLGGNIDASTIHVYRVINPGTIPSSVTYVSTASVTSITDTVTVTAGEYLIGAYKSDNSNAVTWTNSTEQADLAFAAGGRRASSAFVLVATSGSLGITIAGTGSTLRKVTHIKWAP